MKHLRLLLTPYRGLPREIYFIVISRTINSMGALIYPFLTLLLSRKIGLSGGETGIYIALCGTMWAPASILGGKLSDRIGRKNIIVLSEALAACGYLACLFLPPSLPMVYLIMFNSFCYGVAGPSHDAMTADLTGDTQREGAYSLNYLGYNFGFAIAQVWAGFLFENHLPLMFLIDGLTTLFGVTIVLLFVPETMNRKEVTEKGEEGKGAEEAQDGKSIFRVLLDRPLLLSFALVSFGYRFLYSCWPFLIPLHGEYRFPGKGASLFGLLGSFNALTVVLMTPVLTFLFRKSAHIRKIFYAGILFTLGFGLLGFIDFRAAFFIAVLIFTLGEIMEAVSIMPYIMSRTPSSHRGRMSSILPIIMGAGFVYGPIVLGSVLDSTSFPFTWHVAASVGAAATLGMGLISRRERRKITA